MVKTAKSKTAPKAKPAAKKAKTPVKPKAKPVPKEATKTDAAPPAANTLPAKPVSRPTGDSKIYCGIGGWTFEPWRGVFYPDKLPKTRELSYAAEHLTSIEINGTYYSTQKPETFRRWADETPAGFVFAVKGNRFVTNRRVLAEAGDSVKRFLESGVTQLGSKLGPLLWQFAPFKKFDEADFGAFLELLPPELDGLKLRHVVEVRHASFACEAFVNLVRRFNIGIVYADHASYPGISDVTSDFVYARLQTGTDDVATAYPPKQLDEWIARARLWAGGGEPDDLPRASKTPAAKQPRDVFMYIIHEGKIRAPAGAMALIERLEK